MTVKPPPPPSGSTTIRTAAKVQYNYMCHYFCFEYSICWYTGSAEVRVGRDTGRGGEGGAAKDNDRHQGWGQMLEEGAEVCWRGWGGGGGGLKTGVTVTGRVEGRVEGQVELGTVTVTGGGEGSF